MDKFKERLGAEVRRMKEVEQRWKVKMNPETEEFRKRELLRRYTVKLLYGWDNKKFEKEYLKKLERNWDRWKNNRKVDKKEYRRKLEKSFE